MAEAVPEAGELSETEEAPSESVQDSIRDEVRRAMVF